MAAQHPLDQELGDLWFNRATLDTEGWRRLYEIVCSALIPVRSRYLGGLTGERKDLVQDFFMDVVMRPSSIPARYHVGSLKYIYQNYLITCLRKENRHNQIFVSDTADDNGEHEHSAQISNDDDSNMTLGFSELSDAGWPLDRLEKSVHDWLTQNEPWVPLYLSFHYCADAHVSEPLQKLARRYGIRSYAYKAKALGFNWDMEKAVASGETFSHTLIGRWLTEDLGIGVNRDNGRIIHNALKILCLGALNWADEQESAS